MWVPHARAGEKEPQSGPDWLCPELQPSQCGHWQSQARLGSQLQAQHQSGALASPQPRSQGTRCPCSQHSSGLSGSELSRRSRVRAEGGNPLGRRPQLPTGWERRPPPGARLALKTWPVGPKWLGPRWLHTQHPVCPARGAHLLGEQGPPSLSADRELSGPSPRLPLLPRSAEQGTARPPGGSPRSAASCLPAPTGSAPGGGGREATPCPQPGGRAGVSSTVLVPGTHRASEWTLEKLWHQ